MTNQPRRSPGRIPFHRGTVIASVATAWLSVCSALGATPVAPSQVTESTAAPAAPAAPDASTPETPATGRQHLVRPGQDLDVVLDRAAPGDEIILWPGTYRGVSVRGVAGRPDAPIVVRGLRADDPPVIEGGAWGLRLLGVSHLRFSDLIIRRSRIDGIDVGPGDDGTLSRGLRFNRIRIEDVGERPGRHGIALTGVEDVQLRNIAIAGWTGSGVEIVASDAVAIDGLRLEGRGRGELLGIRLRAGTRRCSIMNTLLIEPGLGGIALGGRSRDAEFPADASPDRDGRRWEVSSPTIEDVTIIGSEIALTFLGATQASLNHLTVVDPRRAAVRVARPRDDAQFGCLDAAALSRCLFLWRSDEDPKLAEFGPGSSDEGLWLEENLWWRSGVPFASDHDFPGQESFPQLLTVDPAVGDDLRPRTAAAVDFGARTRPWFGDPAATQTAAAPTG